MMEVETKVPWDVALEERLEREGEKYPDDAKRIRQERYHTRVFHERQWPDIQVELRERHDRVVSNDEEPHWVEPWKASYWHKSVDLKGKVTWSMTLPLSADAASIARYLKKGMLLRAPRGYNLSNADFISTSEGTVVAELPSKHETVPQTTKKLRCTKCRRMFNTKRGRKIHMGSIHRRE